MDRTRTKPFEISKKSVLLAYQKVKENRGACGVDRVSLEDFEKGLRGNLYKIWNRMSSGSYFPPPVRRVEIPKANGGTRPLGIPTVGDRVAQMVVKMELEPKLEPIFHDWSFGYRPGRSALDAVGMARRNCWKQNWVLDLDIKGFFEAIDHDLLMKAVRRHISNRWVLLYVERWLKVPVIQEDGTQEDRRKGTPQGGVVSPILANLFLHYAFDTWMGRQWPEIRFERYADDIICHCQTEVQAVQLLGRLRERLRACGLELHQEKTRIIYCKDGRRKDKREKTKFEFLGFEFRGRWAKNRKGEMFVGFNPGISPEKTKGIRNRIRGLVGPKQCGWSLGLLADILRPLIRGWWNYYGAFFPSVLHQKVGLFLDRRLLHWARRKYKRLGDSWLKAGAWLKCLRHSRKELFPHWVRVGRAV